MVTKKVGMKQYGPVERKTSNFVEDLYRARLQEAKELGGDADNLHAQEQGEHGVSIRYPYIRDKLGDLSVKSVLDLGCGNTWFMRNMYGTPCVYVGVDLLEQRREDVKLFAIENSLEYWNFVRKPADLAFWDMPKYNADVDRFDVVLAVGLMGYWGMHSLQALAKMIKHMRDQGDSGVITAPTFWGPEANTDTYMMRFAQDDLAHLAAQYCVGIDFLDREAVLTWNL